MRKQFLGWNPHQIAVGQCHDLAHVPGVANAVGAEHIAFHRKGNDMFATLDIGHAGLHGAQANHVQAVERPTHGQRALARFETAPPEHAGLARLPHRAIEAQQT